MLIKTWRDFNYVNYVIINLEKETVKIVSKNLFKRLLIGKKQYLFEEINFFFNDTTNLFGKAITRYTVYSDTIGNSKVRVLDCSDERQAFSMKKFLSEATLKKVGW